MLTKEAILSKLGIDSKEFNKVAERAHIKAERFQDKTFIENEETAQSDYDILTNIIEFIIENAHIKERINLLFQFYSDAPSFTLIDNLFVQYWKTLSKLEKEQFWDRVSKILESENDTFSAPIEYALWCDFFENPDTVGESWKSLLNKAGNNIAIKRILISSGPVPFELKKADYYKFLSNSELHYYIFRGLLHSAYDVYGSIDKQEAKKILSRLKLDEMPEHYDKLVKLLNEENS